MIKLYTSLREAKEHADIICSFLVCSQTFMVEEG